MSAAGSVIGGLFFIGGIFLVITIIGTMAPGLLIFILFPIFGIIGGTTLGHLNAGWVKRKESKKNEMTAYSTMMFFAIILLGVYYFIFGPGPVGAKNTSGMEDNIIVILGMVSGVLTQLGLGLIVASAYASNR